MRSGFTTRRTGVTVMAWNDEPWCDEGRAWQEGDGRLGCATAVALVALVAWMLVAIAVG